MKGANQAVSLIPSLSCSMCWLHAALAKIAGLAWTAVEGVERFSRKVPPVTVKRGDTRASTQYPESAVALIAYRQHKESCGCNSRCKEGGDKQKTL